MKSARAIVGALLSAVLATLAISLVAQPAASAPPQLAAVSELPADWTCFNSGDCLDFSGYDSGGWRGKADPNAWGTAQCGSGQNCVHYVAWRVVNEWSARDTTPAGTIAANACPMDFAPRAWDTAAAACGWVVDRAAPQAGDILQYDGRQRLDGYGSTGGSGHVDFIDAVEVTESGETLLHISHSGCSSGANIRRTVTLTDVVNSGIDIIHVPYTRDQGAFTESATTADMAQWLYRLAGAPDVDVSFDPFATIEPDDARFRAALWAHTNGIAPAAEFNPDAVLDRQTMAVYLYRYDALDGSREEVPASVAGPADLATSTHPSEVAWIVGAGYASVGEGNVYQPTAPVSTAALAEVFYAFEGEPAVTHPERSPWYDLVAGDEHFDAALWTWDNYISRDRFVDVPMTHAYYSHIVRMESRGLIEEFPDGTFRTDALVTRQEAASYLYRLAGQPPVASPVDPEFDDVDSDHPFFTEITWMAQQGILGGYPDGTFRPTDTVTRQSLAVLLYRAAGSPDYTVPSEASFTDVSTASLNSKEIEWAIASGSMSARADGSFAPSDLVTRETLVAIMARYAPAPSQTTR